MKSEYLLAIVDFLYCGEANVFQDNLDSFLAIAEELQLKGLMGKTDEKFEDTKVDEKSLHSHLGMLISQKLPFKVRHPKEISIILEKIKHWPFLETILWTLKNLKKE